MTNEFGMMKRMSPVTRRTKQTSRSKADRGAFVRGGGRQRRYPKGEHERQKLDEYIYKRAFHCWTIGDQDWFDLAQVRMTNLNHDFARRNGGERDLLGPAVVESHTVAGGFPSVRREANVGSAKTIGDLHDKEPTSTYAGWSCDDKDGVDFLWELSCLKGRMGSHTDVLPWGELSRSRMAAR